MYEEIVSGSGEVITVNRNGNTKDIIEEIINADKCGVPYMAEFAPNLQGATVYETCENIYQFVHSNIPYVEDPEGVQNVQSPGSVWNNRFSSKGGTGQGADCKSMSILCSSLLRALSPANYNFKYRFISEDPEADFYHVYLVVMNDAGNGYIVLDCTLPVFDQELNVAKYMDLDPAPPGSVCPYPSPAEESSAIMGPQYVFDTTIDAEGNQANQWSAHEADYMNGQLRTDQALLQGVVLSEVTAHFQGKPTQRGHAVDYINGNWNDFLKFAHLMIYRYYGDATLEMGDFQGKPIPPLADVDIKIGAAYITVKKQVADDFYDDLLEMGVSTATLKRLVNMSVWAAYAVTMDYMLYRCYNKLTYGQEWGTIPGVPYYDANTKIFYPNGSSLRDFLALAFAFPLEGGTGKPWGLPYISRGIFIMTNGASDAAVEALTAQVNRAGWNNFINTRIFPGGTTNWEAQQNSPEKALLSTTIYYKWLYGHLPVLYSNSVISTQLADGYAGSNIVLSGPKIALAPGVIEGIVAAVGAIIAAFMAALPKIIQAAKSSGDKMKNYPAIPPSDFKMQYQTADGCYIGYSNNCESGVAKMCKDGVVQCNPNLQLPENSPPPQWTQPGCTDPNSQFYNPLATEDDGSCDDGKPNSNKLLWVAGGIALIGAGLMLSGGEEEK